MSLRNGVDRIASKVLDGGRVDAAEALELYRHAPTHLLGHLADTIRARKHPERIVTYIIDRNVNYTNICVARCNFCAFYRPVGASDGYVLGFEEIFRKIDETIAVGGNQLLLQGGHNPDLPLQWYEDLFRAVKAKYPDFKLHAMNAVKPPVRSCSSRSRTRCSMRSSSVSTLPYIMVAVVRRPASCASPMIRSHSSAVDLL